MHVCSCAGHGEVVVRLRKLFSAKLEDIKILIRRDPPTPRNAATPDTGEEEEEEGKKKIDEEPYIFMYMWVE